MELFFFLILLFVSSRILTKLLPESRNVNVHLRHLYQSREATGFFFGNIARTGTIISAHSGLLLKLMAGFLFYESFLNRDFDVIFINEINVL